MAIEIVDFPIKMVNFHSYVAVYQTYHAIFGMDEHPFTSQKMVFTRLAGF